MHKPLRLIATVKKSPNKGGWHYVSVPDNILVELREQAGKNGNVPVLASMGNTSWKSTIMSRGNQQWYLPLSVTVREAEAINKGDRVSVLIAPDHKKLESFKKS